MRRWYVKRIVVTTVGILAALAVFYILFAAFLMLVRDAGETERRDVIVREYGHGPEAEEFAEDMDVPSIEIYREGDGPAPVWYRPNEPMAAEWTAEVKDGLDTLPEAERNENNEALILDVPLSEEFQIYLHGLCEEYGVPYTLAIAVIEAESTYRADAVSDDGDYGLMQINWRCHEWLELELGVTDWLDPYQNAKAGVWILGLYYTEYGAESGTLMAYNMGQAAAESMFAAGVYETDYSRRVIGIRWRLENDA